MLRIAELLPKGNLKKPNANLSVEWFYMTFHKVNRAEYVHSGCKLCKETLQSLAEYFKTIYDAQLNDGSYQHHQLDKVQANAKRKMCKELEEHYACKFVILQTIINLLGCAVCNVMMDIVDTITASVTRVMNAVAIHATKRVPPRVTTRISSLAMYTASMTSTPTRNDGQTCAIKLTNCAQTTTTIARTPIIRATTNMTRATLAAPMSCAGVTTLLCPATGR